MSTIDAVYTERNRLVALLARLYPSGLKTTVISGWDPEWHGCVYIDLPTGQASWHFHDSDAHLFAGLPPYAGEWDGHSTEEKYARIEKLCSAIGRPPAAPEGWTKVVYAVELGEFDECPQCGDDYTVCPCPGPTMDGWEYRYFDGVLYARPEEEEEE